jgi:hypothetical protein
MARKDRRRIRFGKAWRRIRAASLAAFQDPQEQFFQVGWPRDRRIEWIEGTSDLELLEFERVWVSDAPVTSTCAATATWLREVCRYTPHHDDPFYERAALASRLMASANGRSASP